MARIPVEIGQSYHKTGTPYVIWIVDRINEYSDPLHVRLARLDDPTTQITISIDSLTDPRHFRLNPADG